MRTSSRVAAGVVAALLGTVSLGTAGAADAAPGTRSESPLRLSLHCTQDGARVDARWRSDRADAYYQLGTDQGSYAYPGYREPGWQPDLAPFPVKAGSVTVVLLVAGAEVARRSLTVPGCDAWPGVGAYLSSGANEPGAPQSVGPLTGQSFRTANGTQVVAARDGDLVAAPDGTTHAVRGAIDAYWRAAGGITGRLGAPTGSEVEVADGSGFSTAFEGGWVFWSPATGAHAVRGYPYGVGLDGTEQNPGPGYPIDDGVDVSDPAIGQIGWYQHFENAVEYRSLYGAGYVFNGPIMDLYARTGYENGPLGWQVSGREGFQYAHATTNDPDSWRQRFQFGAIFEPLHGTVPARVLYGAIAARYQGGNDRSDFSYATRLGYPLTDELATPDGVGRYAHFANAASIYWTQATGAQEIVDRGYGLRTYWGSRGWERSTLGYPTASQVSLTVPNPFGSTGGVQQFTGGNAYARWDAEANTYRTFTVRGAFLSTWGSLGWEGSGLGYPTSEEFGVSGGVRQTFQGGTLDWNAGTGQVTVTR